MNTFKLPLLIPMDRHIDSELLLTAIKTNKPKTKMLEILSFKGYVSATRWFLYYEGKRPTKKEIYKELDRFIGKHSWGIIQKG